jgi:hypothetical protein
MDTVKLIYEVQDDSCVPTQSLWTQIRTHMKKATYGWPGCHIHIKIKFQIIGLNHGFITAEEGMKSEPYPIGKCSQHQ